MKAKCKADLTQVSDCGKVSCTVVPSKLIQTDHRNIPLGGRGVTMREYNFQINETSLLHLCSKTNYYLELVIHLNMATNNLSKL